MRPTNITIEPNGSLLVHLARDDDEEALLVMNGRDVNNGPAQGYFKMQQVNTEMTCDQIFDFLRRVFQSTRDMPEK